MWAGTLRKDGYYTLLTVVNRRGVPLLPLADELAPATLPNGEPGARLTPAALGRGAVRLKWERGYYNNTRLHAEIRRWIFQNQFALDMVKRACSGGLMIFAFGLIVAIPGERKRIHVLKYGRRLRGPEMVTASEFNHRKRAGGVGFINQERTLGGKIFGQGRMVRVPREEESFHILAMGDTGMGKSALIRQILTQVEDRDEAAIVYDPALEYTPQFYQPERGDMILNPLDQRMPYWKPGDEVRHDAEALTLAASLYPDLPAKDRFFTRGPREVFAHLLSFKPGPEELAHWMCHDEEIQRRVRGTEMASTLAEAASEQREGVLAELKMVGRIFRLLPSECQTERRWTTREWARERKGWLFLTTTPETRELEGKAGVGKTTSIAAIRDAAGREGYKVEGLAPTSRAAHKLREAGIESGTLQRHLARTKHVDDAEKSLYILDESSLASTKQMHKFIHRLHLDDRVLLVGDVRQHEAVEAGRPYHQLQEAGMNTVKLDEIVRHQDPALKEVVEQLAAEDVRRAIQNLERQGRVHEIIDRGERLREISRQYVARPEGTLVISPDNRSRQEINELIHKEMQEGRRVEQTERRVKVLVPRQEMTGADRQWAGQYEPGDVVRYTKGSKVLGIEASEYARVKSIDQEQNQITVERVNGERVSYDPRRLQGVALYREAERALAEGDRVQFTAPLREQHIANRDLGTVEKIEASGEVKIRLDSDREVHLSLRELQHLDYGYAVTGHSSQGQTADRVLIHVDTEQSHPNLINSRMAYVSVSRARYDAQIYTNDRANLGEELSRDVLHRSAIQQGHAAEMQPGQNLVPSQAAIQAHETVSVRGHAIGR